jgi:mucin-2
VTYAGTTYTFTNTFYCPVGSFGAGQGYSATYSDDQSTTNQSLAQAQTAAQNEVYAQGATWQNTYCYSYYAIESATVTNPTTGAVCAATASETSPMSQAAADAAATDAATTMADVACGVTPGSGTGTISATETRSFTGLVTANYTGCVNGILTPETFPYTGTSPSETATAYGPTLAQAQDNAAAAAVAMGQANLQSTVNGLAPPDATSATCSSTTTTTTPTTTTGGSTTTAPTSSSTAPTSSSTTPTSTVTPTSTTTKVQNIWLPIVAVVNSAHVVINTNETIRVLLVPLTQVAATTPTLETTNPVTGVTTAGCTPTKDVAPFSSTNPMGSYTLPNCSIVGGVGDTVLFNFESDTGLAVNSAPFTIPSVVASSSSTSSFTCPNGGHLDASGTSCVVTSTTAATHLQTGSTPVYGDGYTCPSDASLSGTSCVVTSTTAASYAQTGSTPIYTYEQTGTTPTYGNVQTGTGYRYGIVGGGGWYAIRGCVRYTASGGCVWGTVGYGQNPYVYGITGSYPVYTYKQTGTTPTYGNVQTGSTPVYGYTCPSGASLSGTSCVTTSTTAATHVQTGSTPVYGDGYTCPSGASLSGTSCVTTNDYTATYATVSDAVAWQSGVGPDFRPDG